MKTNITERQFDKLASEISREMKEYPCLRYGQAAYNLLYHFYPTVLESNKDFDTFEWKDSTEVLNEIKKKLVK